MSGEEPATRKNGEYQGDASSRIDLKDDMLAKENGKHTDLMQNSPTEKQNGARELGELSANRQRRNSNWLKRMATSTLEVRKAM